MYVWDSRFWIEVPNSCNALCTPYYAISSLGEHCLYTSFANSALIQLATIYNCNVKWQSYHIMSQVHAALCACHFTASYSQISPAEIPGATASTASAAEAKTLEAATPTQPPAASEGESPAPVRVAEGQGEAPKASGPAPSTFAALAASSAPFAAVSTSNSFGFGSLANGSDKASTNGAAGKARLDSMSAYVNYIGTSMDNTAR